MGEDTYNGTELTVPFVVIGSSTYSNVVVTPERILAVNGGIPNGGADTYIPASNQLMIPAVYYAGSTYTNVVISVGSLVAVGNVRGVDFYASPELFIPSVQVLGGSVYSDVVITVDKILSAGGGMPENVQDVYDRATKQLTIAGIEYNGTVYTIRNANDRCSRGPLSCQSEAPRLRIQYFNVQWKFCQWQHGWRSPQWRTIQGGDGNFYGTRRRWLVEPTGMAPSLELPRLAAKHLLFLHGRRKRRWRHCPAVRMALILEAGFDPGKRRAISMEPHPTWRTLWRWHRI